VDIEARGITVGFNGVPVLRDVALALRSGETLGLIGPNGSGKTTLLRMLANLRSPQSGSVRYGGLSARDVGAQELARRLAYVAQGGTAHWSMRVQTLVALGRQPHRRPFRGPSADDRKAIERALATTGVVALRNRTMDQVSGGERMRVLLARTLAVEAETWLADEPIAALDPLHQLHVMKLLRQMTREGRNVIVVLHDLSLAMRYCDRLVLLARGGVLTQGNPEQVLTDQHIAAAYGVDVARGEHGGVPFLVPWAPSRKTEGKTSDDPGRGFRGFGAAYG
jgi:iron complex transport system ATP-binding protein